VEEVSEEVLGVSILLTFSDSEEKAKEEKIESLRRNKGLLL
jgi:hypothetical protein